MATVDAQILSVGANISGNIDALDQDRPLLSQNMLAQLRNCIFAANMLFQPLQPRTVGRAAWCAIWCSLWVCYQALIW
jgi:hypothetical protein